MEFFDPAVKPVPLECFEDLVPGRDVELGSATIDLHDTVEFARIYDPQPFHLDEKAAEESVFRGFSASGFQTFGIAWATAVRSGYFGHANLAGAGMDEGRWLKPVRPGEILATRCRAESVTPSKSRGDRARVVMRYEVRNQDGDLVASFLVHHVMRGRSYGAEKG